MEIDNNSIERFVNLKSYSSSIGFLGYLERVGPFSEGICHKTIESFFKAFDPSNNNIYLISSLYVDSDLNTIKKEYEISDELLKNYLKQLIASGAINTINYNEMGNDYDSDEYLDKIDSFDKHFVVLKNQDIDLIKKIFFSVMFIDGIRGHCFAILEEKKLIVYPHEEIGFGFISFGGDKKSMSQYIRDEFNSEMFNMTLNF